MDPYGSCVGDSCFSLGEENSGYRAITLKKLISAACAALVLSIPALSASLDDEVAIRQQLIQVALAREDADLILRGASTLNVFSSTWMPDQEIVIRGKRIAWVGPSGQWRGNAREIVDVRGLWAVPGFGESHKHIESSYLTPEYEAALVVPGGNTWTVEGSHELSNVVGMKNVEFWLAAEDGESSENLSSYWLSDAPYRLRESGGVLWL